MSPFFTTTIFFAIAILATRVSKLLLNKRKSVKERLFRQLSKEGSANNLVFCSQEMLSNKVMGVDGIHRKLMILEKVGRKYQSGIISLDAMQSCDLKKSYGSKVNENAGDVQIERALSKIELQLGARNDGRPASITFYDHLLNSRREVVLMKAKAEYWSVMFSKMLVGQVKEARA